MKCAETRAPWRIAMLHVAIAMVPGILLSSAYARSNEVIWEGNDQAVLLAPQDDETAPPNDHPVSIGSQAIEEMLASLRLRYLDQEPATPPVAVFNQDQVDILGEALATGLARAEASQDVTFSIIGAHRLSPGAFARRNRLTAGRVFFREGKLNLIFGEIQSPYRKKNIYGRTDEDFYPRKYGRRASAGEHEAVLLESTFGTLRSAPEGTREDWVVFEPDLNSADRATVGTVPEEPHPLPPAAEARRTPTSTMDGTARPDEAIRHREAIDTANIEQRLETLKRLRDKDLISEEAYRQKVDEILNDL